jgi:pyridoxine kinase
MAERTFAVTVISIQSQVAHGHVGNSAAVFALQLLGIEVAAVPTVLFSNHPRYSSMYGNVLSAELVRDLLTGIEDRGLVDNCKILISGYLGSPEIAAVVIDFVRRAKAQNPKLLYLCDPVMGDAATGFYVSEELQALFAKALVPLANIITPNQLELERLVCRKLATIQAIAAAARGLEPSTNIVTGVLVEQTPPNMVQTLAIEPGAIWMTATPKLSCNPSGTGDLFTALFAAAIAQGRAAKAALECAVSGIHAVLEETVTRRSYEMALVPAAERLLYPDCQFTAYAISPHINTSGLGESPAPSQ